MDAKKMVNIGRWQGLIAFLAIGIIVLFKPLLWPGGLGLKEYQVITSIEEKNAEGKVSKSVETTIQPGKTLWDWLTLLGIPLSLAILGYWLQEQQRQRDAEAADKQQEITEINAKEDALQAYVDTLSKLLIDQHLIELSSTSHLNLTSWSESYATSLDPDEVHQNKIALAKKQELLDAATDVIRARTLSILRRFDNDEERKTSVIRFLVESEIINKLDISLSGANLSGADLRGVNLSGVDLSRANLERINLGPIDNNIGGTYTSGADLRGANLSWATLSGANLCRTNLSGANMTGVLLAGANLAGATFDGTVLNDAILLNTDFREVKGITEQQLQEGTPPLIYNSPFPAELNIDLCRDYNKVPEVLLMRNPNWFKDLEDAKHQLTSRMKQTQWK